MPELRELRELSFTYGPEGAQTLAKVLNSLALRIPEGRYHALLRDREAHILPVDQRIDRFDTSPDTCIDLRDEGVVLGLASAEMKAVVLHRRVDPSSADLPHVTAEDLPVVPLIEQYTMLASSAPEDPEALAQRTALLEQIRAAYKNESTGASAKTTGKPKHAAS